MMLPGGDGVAGVDGVANVAGVAELNGLVVVMAYDEMRANAE